MRENENAASVLSGEGFLAAENDELIRLSEMIRSDALRYDRLIDAEEDVYEL